MLLKCEKKQILSEAPSMIRKFILTYLLIITFLNSNSHSEDSRNFEFDKGIITLMYHRFDENKYPSTNIQIDVFEDQIKTIEEIFFSYSS